ncbi:CPBP family intramembrane glutamic endopeptidase [Actinospica robiniae]|uniref:CPBP family intramembrane glutamic endopeptidase n=1 Tax=Actinospica robiniae TaxID=304901 RepID=UPI00041AEE9C|nr:CPBP family intramembrane glutamic endopeptidase [Actinospica robiniae]
MEIEERIPESAENPAPAAPVRPEPRRIGVPRALGEILAVYVPSFGLGVFTALVLLHNPSLGNNDQVSGWLPALEEILQYVMQASVTIFGVAFFCVQRGVTLPMLFGKPSRQPEPRLPAGWPAYDGVAQPTQPQPQWGAPPGPEPTRPTQHPQWGHAPQDVQHAPADARPEPTQPMIAEPPTTPVPGWGAWGSEPTQQQAPPPGNGYGFDGQAPMFFPGFPQPPADRGRGWQFARAYFISMAGVLGFLISVVIYTSLTRQQTGAPDQGNSPWLVLVGLVVALSAGFGEEMLITGLVTNALEKAGMTGNRAWVIYLVAICLRIPFHLYYGWASLGVIIFTCVNIYVYRRWRLLWPIILAHATYDFFEYVGSVVPQAAGGLMILGLGLGTLVMLVVILSIENSDRMARRRYDQFVQGQRLAGNPDFAAG